LTPGNTLISAC